MAGAHPEISDTLKLELATVSPGLIVKGREKLSVRDCSKPKAVAITLTLIVTKYSPADNGVPHIVAHP